VEPEENKPKLKLELIRGGSGAGGKTAVGTEQPDNDPEYPLKDIPSWFRLLLPFQSLYLRNMVCSLSHEELGLLLRKAKLSRRYRVLLSWRWNFRLDEVLTRNDAKKLVDLLLPPKGEVKFDRSFEERAAWHIWLYLSQ